MVTEILVISADVPVSDMKCVCVCVCVCVCACVLALPFLYRNNLSVAVTGIFHAFLKNLETDCVVFHAYIHTGLLAEMPSALRTTLSATFCRRNRKITKGHSLTMTFLHVH